MATSCKGVPVPLNYESHYFFIDEDISPLLHTFDQRKKNCEEMKCISFYFELAHLNKER